MLQRSLRGPSGIQNSTGTKPLLAPGAGLCGAEGTQKKGTLFRSARGGSTLQGSGSLPALELSQMASVFQADVSIFSWAWCINLHFPTARIAALAREGWEEDGEDSQPWKGLAGAEISEELLWTGIPGS